MLNKANLSATRELKFPGSFIFCVFNKVTGNYNLMYMMAVQDPNRYFPSLPLLPVHTCCAHYSGDVLQATRTRAEIHVMNYATKCRIKMKAKFLSLTNQV